MDGDMLDLLVTINSEATAVSGHFQIKADWWEVDPAWIATIRAWITTHTDYPAVLDDVVEHAEPMMVPYFFDGDEGEDEEYPAIVLPFAVMEAIALYLMEYRDEQP